MRSEHVGAHSSTAVGVNGQTGVCIPPRSASALIEGADLSDEIVNRAGNLGGRGRRLVRCLDIRDIVSTFRKMSTKADHAHPSLKLQTDLATR